MTSWDKKLAIILPTFNESKNLRSLLSKIHKVVPYAHVIIVDDSNAIENKKIQKIAGGYKNVKIITRSKKMGRGSAVLQGFEQALVNETISYFVEMDTDLAHDPYDLPQLQKALEAHNAQLVIGSRYISGSKISHYPLKRLMISKLVNFLLNMWFGIKLHDYTNGYRMYQRKTVAFLVKQRFYEKGFIVLSESLFLINRQGFKIIEVPISFTDRKYGESSFGFKELVMFFVGVLRIRMRA